MESKIASAIGMKYSPVAVLFTDDKPENAMQFKEGRWGCVVTMFIAAAKGRTAAFDRKTFGCLGGGVGLGFGNQYVNFPGGIECYISTGNKEFAKSPEAAGFRTSTPLDEGEGYFKSLEIAKKFVDALPMTEVPTTYVVYKPLDQLTEEETPKVVVFLANVEQLSALSVLANYERGTGQSVIIPFGAGCHTIGIMPYAEAKSAEPRAIIGLTDISARRHVDKDILSFAVPFPMFLQMEENVEGSFLNKEVWKNLLESNNVNIKNRNIMESEFYQLKAKKPNGEILEMKNFKGKNVLIVNTATKCGLAPQFDGLETLHQKYKDKGLVVLGFPSAQFLNQEPETNETVEEACKINHGVTFQLTEKIDVNGKNTHPVFAYLKSKKGGFLGNRIKWNFTKFLIDKKGNPVKRFAPTDKPEKIEKDILKLINS